MGDVQQTPGGIAKGHDQFAISRRQLMMRKHGLRCPQTDVTPHSLSTVLCALLQEVDDPSATALAEVLASASSNLGPLWVDQPNQDQSATLDILDFFARRPIGSCNLVLFVHHRLMRGEKSVHDSRIGAEPFVHCET